MSAKPGRNDLCYCGSGKKYKRCHLPLDEKERLASAPPPIPAEVKTPEEEDTVTERESSFAPPGFKGNIRDIFKFATRSGLFRRDPALRQMIKENETLFTFLGNEEEIETATAKLAPYQQEFRQLVEDEEAFLRRSEQLLDEESFAPLRFTAADVERAFAEVGSPPIMSLDEETRNICLKAARFLASKERRDRLSMELLLRVPKYVDQGRFLDACMLEFFSQITLEDREELNPFLLGMFRHGLIAWEDQRQADLSAVVGELGLAMNQSMSPAELEAWAAEQSADPAKTARLEQLLAAHPKLASGAAPSFEAMARQSVKLLDREDARRLWLSPEELHAGMPSFMEKLQRMVEEYPLAEGEDKLPENKAKEAFEAIYLPAIRELVASVFTRERIRKLVTDLRAYRDELFAAGEKEASYCAMSAINYVEPENEPAMNTFLVNLCFRSIHGLAPEAESQED